MPVEATAAAAVFQRPVRERMRAPRQDGHRAQLTVPAPVWERAEEIAGIIGTTPNDVLAIFAGKGMELADRQLETARVAAARVRAYTEAVEPEGADLPTMDELLQAAGALRLELDAE